MANSSTRRRRRNKTRMRKRKENKNQSLISQLPDDILISIISQLTVVEAVRTSILSTRWRNLHKYITRLDFSPTSKQLQIIQEEGDSGHHRVGILDFLRKDANVINRTLQTRNAGACLQEFRLYLPWIYRDEWAIRIKPIEMPIIQRWLDFAFSRPLRIIHVYVNSPYPLRISPFLPRSEDASSFETLKELSLTAVDVAEELFELLLSSFVALERLSIEYDCNLSIDFVRLSGDVMAPKLKHLKLSCWVESVEIRDAVNLEESLTCRPDSKLLLENVPRLVELNTYASTGIQTLCRGNGVMISEQLVKLKLWDAFRSVKDTHVICLLPKLVNLKHLDLECTLYSDDSSNNHHLIHFVEACPCLRKLEIKFKRYAWRMSDKCCTEEMKQIASDFLHLKRVKLSGLFEDHAEMEFGSNIVGQATAIEELAVEVFHDNDRECYTRGRRMRATLRKCFRPMLRDSVNFFCSCLDTSEI